MRVGWGERERQEETLGVMDVFINLIVKLYALNVCNLLDSKMYSCLWDLQGMGFRHLPQENKIHEYTSPSIKWCSICIGPKHTPPSIL